MTTVTISLPESMKEYIDDQVKTKGFGNTSEYFRSLVREAQQREADKRLEQLLIEGLSVGDDIVVTPAFWNDLKAEASARLNEARSKQAPKRKAV